MTSASEADINSLVFTGWFQPTPFPRAGQLQCMSSDGRPDTVAWFENAVRFGVYTLDVAEAVPQAFNALLLSRCQQTDEGGGVVSYDLFLNISDSFSPPDFSRYVPVMSPDNLSCTQAEVDLGNPLLVAANTCLLQDPRSPTDPLGLTVYPPQAIHVLTILLDETVANNPTPPPPDP